MTDSPTAPAAISISNAFQNLVWTMGDLKPLNIWSRSEEEIGRLMSHFAHTPFVLDGVEFGSVEAFYTWLHIVGNPHKRAKVAPMWGPRSKHACPRIYPAEFDYHGRSIPFGSPEYYELIVRANRAKLAAHPEIARAFLATHPRPIVHELPDKDDAHEIFCGIMHRLCDELVHGEIPITEALPGLHEGTTS